MSPLGRQLGTQSGGQSGSASSHTCVTAHIRANDTAAIAGLVVDASNGFNWPEDVTFMTAMLSTILGDTANIQIVMLLPEACTLSSGFWTVDTPPRMTR